MKRLLVVAAALSLAVSCTHDRVDVGRLVENYALVTIPAPDLTGITDNGKEVLRLYRMAADEVDKIYWRQYFGDGDAFLGALTDPSEKCYAEINYGPWDRIDGKPFLPGYGSKPQGAGFYPADMSAAEFDAFSDPAKHSPYTLVQRAGDGSLKTVWYHDAYAGEIGQIEGYLQRAADVTIKESVRHYLLQLIEGLKTDDYYESNKAWLEMNDSKMDLVLGPLEAVDDAVYGTKASYGAYVLLKNLQRTEELDALSARPTTISFRAPSPIFSPATSSTAAAIPMRDSRSLALTSPMTRRSRRNSVHAPLSSTTSSVRSSTARSIRWAAHCSKRCISPTWTPAPSTGSSCSARSRRAWA